MPLGRGTGQRRPSQGRPLLGDPPNRGRGPRYEQAEDPETKNSLG